MSETLELTNRDLLKLHAGLRSLDAFRKSPTEIVSFDFAPKVKWGLVKDAALVEREVENYQKTEADERRKFGIFEGMEQTSENAQKVAHFDNAMDEVREQKVILNGLIFFTLEELLTRPPLPDGKVRPMNELAHSTLTSLRFIIKE